MTEAGATFPNGIDPNDSNLRIAPSYPPEHELRLAMRVLCTCLKLAAVEKPDGTIVPKIKISENVAKITTPCFKEVWRIFDRETDKAIADVITLNDEVIDDEKPYTIFDPNHTWKRKTVENFRAVRLRTQLFKNGECLYQPRALSAIRAHCLAQVDTLWEEVTRFENPHSYYVDLSQKLWDEKNRLLSENQY